MTEKDILNKINKFTFPEMVVWKYVMPNHNLVTDLRFDALDRAEMQLAINRAFDINVSDMEMARAQTIGDIINIIRIKIAQSVPIMQMRARHNMRIM